MISSREGIDKLLLLVDLSEWILMNMFGRVD